MLEVALPFTAHLSLYEKQEMEMMNELLCMDFDVNTDLEPRNNLETFHKGSIDICLLSFRKECNLLISLYA